MSKSENCEMLFPKHTWYLHCGWKNPTYDAIFAYDKNFKKLKFDVLYVHCVQIPSSNKQIGGSNGPIGGSNGPTECYKEANGRSNAPLEARMS